MTVTINRPCFQALSGFLLLNLGMKLIILAYKKFKMVPVCLLDSYLTWGIREIWDLFAKQVHMFATLGQIHALAMM